MATRSRASGAVPNIFWNAIAFRAPGDDDVIVAVANVIEKKRHLGQGGDAVTVIISHQNDFVPAGKVAGHELSTLVHAANREIGFEVLERPIEERTPDVSVSEQHLQHVLHP
jgi:hypothetical protein